MLQQKIDPFRGEGGDMGESNKEIWTRDLWNVDLLQLPLDYQGVPP